MRAGGTDNSKVLLPSPGKIRGLRHGRPHVSFEDIQAVARPVLGHRVILDHTARLDGVTTAGVVEKLLAEIPAQPKPLPGTLSAAKIA